MIYDPPRPYLLKPCEVIPLPVNELLLPDKP
jgi:hypothetical protein